MPPPLAHEGSHEPNLRCRVRSASLDPEKRHAMMSRSRERLSNRGSTTAVVLLVIAALAVIYALFFRP
jgi:hypothetical protein